MSLNNVPDRTKYLVGISLSDHLTGVLADRFVAVQNCSHVEGYKQGPLRRVVFASHRTSA